MSRPFSDLPLERRLEDKGLPVIHLSLFLYILFLLNLNKIAGDANLEWLNKKEFKRRKFIIHINVKHKINVELSNCEAALKPRNHSSWTGTRLDANSKAIRGKQISFWFFSALCCSVSYNDFFLELPNNPMVRCLWWTRRVRCFSLCFQTSSLEFYCARSFFNRHTSIFRIKYF